jgi:hypothetical protein
MVIMIVNKNDLSIASRYEADAPSQNMYGGPWGDPNQFVHVICSESLDPDCVVAVDQGGTIVLEESQDLIDTKTERLWESVRAERDLRLKQCDWTQLPDSPLIAQDKAAWSAYRQALRDITAQPGFPTDVTWPTAPQA